MTPTLQQILDRLHHDLLPTGLGDEMGVYDGIDRTWVAGVGDPGPVPDLPGLVVVTPGRGMGIPEAADPVDVVDPVQRYAIEELWHGWPELTDDRGRFRALLHPAHHDGDLFWCDHSTPVVPVGDWIRCRTSPGPDG